LPKRERIDDLDVSVLDLLRDNVRIPTKAIANKLRKPVRTISYRVKKLERLGVLRSYMAVVDYEKLGKTVICYSIFCENPPKLAQILAKNESVFKVQLGIGEGDISAHVYLDGDFIASELNFENWLRSIGATDFRRFIIARVIKGWV
jgi:DNA-binding Lrp family transcriptional regulator